MIRNRNNTDIIFGATDKKRNGEIVIKSKVNSFFKYCFAIIILFLLKLLLNKMLYSS